MYWKKAEGEISEFNFGIHAHGHKMLSSTC